MFDYYNLKIDDEFKNLIPPLSVEEKSQLEDNIIHDGCREALCVWNKTILDGHNRYEICTQHHIPFKIVYIFLKSREEAIAWICANQLGRRNIIDEARRYLIGKRYEMEKILGAHKTTSKNQYSKKEAKPKMLVEPLIHENARSIRERLGKEYRISHATVDKYGIYTQAVDYLSTFEPLLIPQILSGKIKISQTKIIELSHFSQSDIKKAFANPLENDIISIGYSETRKVLPKKSVISTRQLPYISTVSIKDMPTYDPDAEILSLALTIPSWISSIDRTRATANFDEISVNARYKLQEELYGLRLAVDVMLSEIKEEN